MWIERVSSWYPEARFSPPATADHVDAIGGLLGTRVPVDLRELLMEAGGVRGEYEVDIVWSADQIAASNREFRTREDFRELYAPFDELLFFGDNGGGDQFAFSTQPGIYVWEHETDTRRKVADGLPDYLERALTADGDDWYVDLAD